MKLNEIQKIVYMLPDDRNFILKLFPLFLKIKNEKPEVEQYVITEQNNFFIFLTLPFEIKKVINPKLTSFVEVHRYCVNEHSLFNIDLFFDFIGDNLSSFWGMTLRAKQNWGQNQKLGRFFYKGPKEEMNPFTYIKNEKVIKNDLFVNRSLDYTFYYLEKNDAEKNLKLWNEVIENTPGPITVYTNFEDSDFDHFLRSCSNITIFEEKNESYLPALISKSKGVLTNSAWLVNLSCYLNRKSFILTEIEDFLFQDQNLIEVIIKFSIPNLIRYNNEKQELQGIDDLITHLEKELF